MHKSFFFRTKTNLSKSLISKPIIQHNSNKKYFFLVWNYNKSLYMITFDLFDLLYIYNVFHCPFIKTFPIYFTYHFLSIIIFLNHGSFRISSTFSNGKWIVFLSYVNVKWYNVLGMLVMLARGKTGTFSKFFEQNL